MSKPSGNCSQYDCVVDGLDFEHSLDDVVTRLKNDGNPTSQLLDHHGLSVFLTRCVEACHDALDRQRYAPPPVGTDGINVSDSLPEIPW